MSATPPIRGIYLLPNLATTAALFCGFYSIVAAIDGRFAEAANAILLAGVFDGLDGKIARLTHSASAFGVQYDSLSDLTSFGLAPGLLVYLWALQQFHRIGWLAAFLYVVCAALRLARFNVEVAVEDERYFHGLPSPAAAAVLATTVLFYHQIQSLLGYPQVVGRPVWFVVVAYGVAFLMVSNIRFRSFKDLDLRSRYHFKVLLALVFGGIVIVAAHEITLFALAWGYAASGLVGVVRSRRALREVEIDDVDDVELKKDHELP
ncbi:MAG: CDP-diacylglycerol--serine O-phosphatidyltransferase [Nitrospirae bacterium CG18_big_fil_WC_8_21_14_2_50_70_55]|nr:CDP-diacylglycerol--serine O-phosphatidyltransferase [Deltaproteobacteria bacterium]OIP67026.1 MAG: CDP-diacylglycerol--serine O-phosphatidyltransferase [Nitrospirae bacterium CG2_30_70_394]PIQ07294.1 MAG: CDP-diacylglycerol--serine O-phosphatidyltransferase [Nitrospirae bacterium CG18_big_fil_WC_8_21_14_2_50_70_55]PIU80159.1 MAG: CDP-diacylglycerol--serine O-phosphatidyltransferase [Nitrospirae bacterium CG06_land_8_20_14_3_00_70_43]PIW82666.1 MAG: CDP-diacylglycerol--serine O-phosphatidylt